MRVRNRKNANIFIRIRNAIVEYFKIIILIVFFAGICIYNFSYDVTVPSLVAFILSAAIIVIFIIKEKLEEPYLISIISAGLSIIIIWQLFLFIFLICNKYMIPLGYKGLLITYTYVIHLAQFLNISDPSGLIGAFIGGVFSVIAVKITITAAYKKNLEDNIDSASPKIIMTTVPESIDRIVGKGYMSLYNFHGETSFVQHHYTYYIPVYLLNLGGDAINIRLRIPDPLYLAQWKIQSSTYVEIENDSQKNINFTIAEFPILKKGEALEVRLENFLKDTVPNIRFEIEYFDIFSNRYNQFHITKNINTLGNFTLPDSIRRSRKASSIWEKTGVNKFFKKNNVVREENIRNW